MSDQESAARRLVTTPRSSDGDGIEIAYRDRGGELAFADNDAYMRTLPDGVCDLIYVDPPFNTDTTRATEAGVHRFRDRWPDGLEGYLSFLRPRLVEMHRLLSSRGSLYVHVDFRTVHYVKIELDRIFGVGGFLNEIIWSYRTGGRSTRWFARKHDTLLLYAKSPGQHTFNVLRDGAYRTDGLNYDDSGRPFKKTRNGRLYFNKDGPAMTDVWQVPFLSTVAKERTGYPTQKPIALLDRVVLASSNESDVVADFFCGAGTTLVAAARAGRRWIGCDSNRAAVDISADRLARLDRQTAAE